MSTSKPVISPVIESRKEEQVATDVQAHHQPTTVPDGGHRGVGLGGVGEGAQAGCAVATLVDGISRLGVMPLLFATGAGAGSRVALGAAVVFGMAVNTIFATIYIPNWYEVMQHIQEKMAD